MANYTIWDVNELLPGEPWTSAKAIAAFENLDAVCEGAPGAPRIRPSEAIDWAETTNTSPEINWVLGRTAGAGVGGVGTYAILLRIAGIPVNTGATSPGSQFRYSNADARQGGTGPSGTWRLMGVEGSNNDADRTSLWLRIS